MISEPTAWVLLALVILCLGAAIWLNSQHGTTYPWQEQEIPPAPERPHVPGPARDQLARAEVLRVAYNVRRQTKVQREIDAITSREVAVNHPKGS